jgi:hypothetical protein
VESKANGSGTVRRQGKVPLELLKTRNMPPELLITRKIATRTAEGRKVCPELLRNEE